MDIQLIFKIAAVGMIVTVLNQVLKHAGRDEHAFLVTLAGLLLILVWLLPYVADLFDSMRRLFSL